MGKELTNLNDSLREVQTINDIKESIMIADFVGTRLKKSDKDVQQWGFDFCSGYYPTQSHFKFKKSWEWLMPVVEKISTLKAEVKISTGRRRCLISYAESDNDEHWMGRIYIHQDHLIHEEIKDVSLIQCVYKAIVEFIKWYQINKQ